MTPERPTSPARGPSRDPLAEFVASHRDRFDDERPAPATWDAICARLPPLADGDPPPHAATPPPAAAAPRVRPGGRRRRGGGLRRFTATWRQAAAAAAILLLGVAGGVMLADDAPGGSARGSDPGPTGANAAAPAGGAALGGASLASVVERVDDLERAYRRAIDTRLRQVAAYEPEPDLRRELTSLARPEFRVTAELADAPPGSERAVVEAMVQEYQAKLDALEHVLERLRAAEQASRPAAVPPGGRRPTEAL